MKQPQMPFYKVTKKQQQYLKKYVSSNSGDDSGLLGDMGTKN